ncbi:hypothetical protein NQ176_g1663 [Zarea fungicola]|uniref:Uncharacterized protein n=1 Tax=Zarea fungicola TaxID=93591 RepID=A0ACC1NU55_9HYPO|nr:hypothetical protein NQ176_g1663 [Lecanicillium fungicola]
MGKDEWRYKYCDKTYSCSGGTAAPAKHLTDPLRMAMFSQKVPHEQPKFRSIRTIIEQARVTAEEGVRHAVVSTINTETPSTPTNSKCSYVISDIDTWLPNTHQTVKKWVLRQYEDQKEKAKQRIQSAKSRIHISCDLWTPPTSLAILDVVAHYVTEDCKLEHHALALKDIDSVHDGLHLAAATMDVIDD